MRETKSDHIATGFEIKRLLSLILRQKDGETVMAIPFLHEQRVKKATSYSVCKSIRLSKGSGPGEILPIHNSAAKLRMEMGKDEKLATYKAAVLGSQSCTGKGSF